MKKKNNIWIYHLAILGVLLMLTNNCKKDDNNPSNTITDIDGNVYLTVTIGTQVWMAENLKVTKFRNGDPIPEITDGAAWINLTTGAYCNYNNEANNSTPYGRLYNWFAVIDSRNIAPTGWHVPTDAEWEILDDYMGGVGLLGIADAGKLKESGTTHWNSSNSGVTNESGFTALPGGSRIEDGTFRKIKHEGQWWSSTQNEGGTTLAFNRLMFSENNLMFLRFNIKQNGFSVRCVKD